MKITKNSLTERAINLLNSDFAGGNPYSRSIWDWKTYSKRIDKLLCRLKKQEN